MGGPLPEPNLLSYEPRKRSNATRILQVLLPLASWSSAIACVLTIPLIVELGHNSINERPLFAWITYVCTSLATIAARYIFPDGRRKRWLLAIGEGILLSIGWTIGGLLVYGALVYPDPHIIAHNVNYCTFHLQAIGMNMDDYAQEHNGTFPDSLAAIAQYRLNQGFSLDVFACPAAEQVGNLSTPTTQEVLADLLARPAYSYFASGLTKQCDPATVLICDLATNHVTLAAGGDGMHVLRVNGKVEWVEGRDKRRILEELAAGHNPPRPK